MEQIILDLLSRSMEEHNTYINELEMKINPNDEDTQSKVLTDLETFFFKEGLRAGINMMACLDKE